MDTNRLFPRLARALRGLLVLPVILPVILPAMLAATALATAEAAEADPPGRVGRLALVDGPVSLLDAEGGDWRAADADGDRNRPLTSGDRLATGPGGRAEARIGSTVLRLSERSELELSRLDDERLVLRLHRGSLALRVASRELAEQTEVITGEARLAPAGVGLFRIDRRLDGERDRTLVQAWRGTLRVDGGPVLGGGERLLLWRDGTRLRQEDRAAETDEFADWVAREDRRDARLEEQLAQDAERRQAPGVSPEMTGAEELARHGRWDRHPEHGWVWLPTDVAADWAPYRHGRWVWLRPWGWTWVDRAPWGFAPFHYGRWVQWHGRWAWWPGEYSLRPVFAPALVVWAGSPGLNVSVQVGGPGLGWAPLAPREPYRPWYRHSEIHLKHVDPWQPHWGPRPPRPYAQPLPDSLLRRPIEQVRMQAGQQAQVPLERKPERAAPEAWERADERRDVRGNRGDERRLDRRDDRRDERRDDRGDNRREDWRDDRRDDRRDVRAPVRPAPPAAQPVAPAPAPVIAAPRPERGGLVGGAIERQREAATRETTARETAARKDEPEGRKQTPAAKPGERAVQQR